MKGKGVLDRVHGESKTEVDKAGISTAATASRTRRADASPADAREEWRDEDKVKLFVRVFKCDFGSSEWRANVKASKEALSNVQPDEIIYKHGDEDMDFWAGLVEEDYNDNTTPCYKEKVAKLAYPGHSFINVQIAPYSSSQVIDLK